MGKASKRPGRAARDIHAAIRAAADAVRSMPAGGASDADTWPELAELLAQARAAVESATPAGFEFHGRRYFLRVALVGVHIEVFDHPAAGEPLVRGASLSSERFGHAPAH